MPHVDGGCVFPTPVARIRSREMVGLSWNQLTSDLAFTE